MSREKKAYLKELKRNKATTTFGNGTLIVYFDSAIPISEGQIKILPPPKKLET